MSANTAVSVTKNLTLFDATRLTDKATVVHLAATYSGVAMNYFI